MSDGRLIELRPLARNEDLPLHNAPSAMGRAASQGRLEIQTFAEVNEQIGIFYVPNYIPPNFKIVQVKALGEVAAYQVYDRSASSSPGRITIRQHFRPGRPMVREGYYREFNVGGYFGYMVEGGWAVSSSETGHSVAHWDSKLFTNLLFEMEDVWFSLRAYHPQRRTFDAEVQLAKIAESLAPMQ